MTASIPATTLEKFTTFGDLLRFLRRRVGLTQMELAASVGYSDAQISRLEQNLRLPDIPTIKLRFITALAIEDESKTVARLLDLAANVRREDAPGLGLCPYKGLNYFDESDADLFVGRETLTSKLTERLISLTGSAMRFLAVVGASGSGKSSLVRAGLVPALRWNQISTDWNIQIITPTAHPLESLANSMAQENEIASLIKDMLSDSQSLSHCIKNGSYLLLVVDQFEETFALCHSEEERCAFISNLLTAASEPDGHIFVAITLRADFYAHCANYIQLREALAGQQEYIGAMTDDEMRRAIEEPARRERWEFETGLVDVLLHDVGHEPGALPLLSHALLETWQRRRARMMTLSGYTSSGGVRGAIAETAESILSDQFTIDQRAIARRIFLRLTELSDETAASDTRRRASFKELILKPEESSSTRNVLKALADARLITTAEDSAEVAHEALIREWPTLRGWLEENREGLRLHRHLTHAAQEWETSNYENDVLYRGARLAQALEWLSSHQEEINDLERSFLKESRSFVEREAIEKEIRRQRELEAAQKLAEVEGKRAEEQAHAATQLRRRAVHLGMAFVAAILMAIVAVFFGWRSQIVSRIAASRELAAASINNLESDPVLSILLALEALGKEQTLEAENALHQAVLASRIRLVIPAHEPGAPISVDFSPDGMHIATASNENIVNIWDVKTGGLLFSVDGVYAEFSPDGTVLATVMANGTVKIWDASSGIEVDVPSQMEATTSITFSPEGARLATVANGNLPTIWNLKSGHALADFPGHTDYVSFAYFSPDGGRLLTVSDDKTARIWNASTGEELLTLGHSDWVWNAAFSPNGERVATLSQDKAVIWSAVTAEKISTLDGHLSTLHAVAYSPDGALLATGGDDRKVIVWDVNTGEALFTLAGHTGTVFSAAFSPDGTRLVTAGDDGMVRVWDVTPEHEELTLTYASSGGQILFNPKGDQIAAIEGGVVNIWDASYGNKIQTLSADAGDITAFAYSPNGNLIAAARNDFSLALLNPASKTEIYTWSAHTGLINALIFSPDGKWLVSASNDYKVNIWDMSQITPSLLFPFNLPVGVQSLAFNSSGTQLAIGLQNGTVQVRDFVTGSNPLLLRGHSNSVTSVAFSTDDRLIATASLDGTVRIWDAMTAEEQYRLEHSNTVTSVAFSRDGARLATASRDGTTKLWDVKTGQELIAFFGDGSGVNSLAFNSNGSRLAASSDHEARIYLMQVDDLVKLGQSRAPRRLTDEECLKYLHGITDSCGGNPAVPTITPLPATINGRICQITNSSGLNDNYFNELIYKGIQESAQTHNWEATVLQSSSVSDFSKLVKTFADADCRLIISPGNLLEQLQTAAQVNPNQRFMVMDFGIDPPLENVWVQEYATDQAAFLAGYLSASVTKTGKVGVFGGIDIPPVTSFMDGFTLGVKYYNQQKGTNVKVIGWDVDKHEGLFTGGFCCSVEGRQAARQLLDAGADVILPVAGQSVGIGAGAEIQEQGNAWIVGVDTDWAKTNPEFEDIILTSIEKRFDVSVTQTSNAIANNLFSGGYHVGTLKTGEVGLSSTNKLPAEIQAELERIKAEIISGKIKTTP